MIYSNVMCLWADGLYNVCEFGLFILHHWNFLEGTQIHQKTIIKYVEHLLLTHNKLGLHGQSHRTILPYKFEKQ